jgi:hypothetical protein
MLRILLIRKNESKQNFELTSIRASPLSAQNAFIAPMDNYFRNLSIY